MLEFLIFWQFFSALLTLFVGVGLLLFIRKKTRQNIKDNRPAGFWIRAICLGIDLAIIDILQLVLAFHGGLKSFGYISVLLTFSYFFFFWLFFAATPAMMLAKIKILARDGGTLKIWQALVRLGMFVFLFIGWIQMLFDKKEKKALHDIVSQTRVAYTEKAAKADSSWVKKVKFVMVGLIAVLLTGLIVYGFEEKLTKYTENAQISFFDLNEDWVADGLIMDVDKDGKADVFKYDLDNDFFVDFTTLDADKDGVAESIDVNNDGRIDGFDFDKDNILDIPVRDGQLFIWLWRILFSAWGTGFIALLVYAILKENKREA